MAVRQVTKNQVTKDGRSWVFNIIIYDTVGNKKIWFKKTSYKTRSKRS